MRRLVWTGLVILICVACNASSSDTVIPTEADIVSLATARFLTENAPPPGFGLVNFDPIDANLSAWQGWRYVASGNFEGTFDDTGEPAAGSFEAEVQANELGEARRVILRVEGGALSPSDAPRRLEGVRLSNDYYFVDTNGVCTSGGDGAEVIADLSAGQLIGGVISATPTGHQDTIEGIEVWQYTFAPENLRLPALHRGPDSAVAMGADLWIAPGLNAVLRMEINLTVEGVRILSGERAVSGALTLRYKLNVPELNMLPNISIPNGC
jgi:hypothetical protein